MKISIKKTAFVLIIILLLVAFSFRDKSTDHPKQIPTSIKNFLHNIDQEIKEEGFYPDEEWRTIYPESVYFRHFRDKNGVIIKIEAFPSSDLSGPGRYSKKLEYYPHR